MPTRKKPIHLPIVPQPEAEQRLAEHFKRLFAADAASIAEQAVRLYEAEMKSKAKHPKV